MAARRPPSELLKPGFVSAREGEVAFETVRCEKSLIIALMAPSLEENMVFNEGERKQELPAGSRKASLFSSGLAFPYLWE